jgi:hypothetical protein
MGGTSSDVAHKVVTDSAGNVYFGGAYFSNSVEFNTTGSGPSDVHIGTTNVSSIFLTKINANGSYGYTYSIDSVRGRTYDVTRDSHDNVYFVGYFRGTNVDFNTTGSGSSDLKSSNGSDDIFISKINSDGSYGWTKTTGGTGADDGNGVTVDALDDLYVVSIFSSSSVNFDLTGGTDTKSKIGSQDIAVTKLNADGTYGWTYTLGESGGSMVAENGVSVDTNGNLYLTGGFPDPNLDGVNFNPFGGTDLHYNADNINSMDIFLTKWTNVFTRPTTSSGSSSGPSERSMPGAPVCGDEKPASAPYIFQVDVTRNSATLHINPAGGAYDKYYIAYGTPWGGDEQYGVEFPQSFVDGALTYTINFLAPNTIYNFKVRAGKGCMPGDWSNVFRLKTTSGSNSTRIFTTFTM